jgi:hypothetical protein
MLARDFTGVLRDIAEVAGTDAAFAIGKAYGGRRVYFPCRQTLERGDAQWLIELVGEKAAFKIVDRLIAISCVIEIPIHPTRFIERRERVRALSTQGMSVQQIAREVNVSWRLVYIIRADLRKDGLL